MNGEEKPTEAPEEAREQKEIANMDEYDYFDLLIESRIISLS